MSDTHQNQPFGEEFPWFSDEETARPATCHGDVVSLADERSARNEACVLMTTTAQRLGLGPCVVATASVYLHVFYTRRSMLEYDTSATAAACVALASEAEGQPFEVREVVGALLSTVADAPAPLEVRLAFRVRVEQCLPALREDIPTGARARHPREALRLLLADVYGGDAQLPSFRGPVTVQALANASAYVVNDTFRTAACVQHRPQAIAAAAFWVAHRVLRVGQPLVTSAAAGGDFVPWYQHWGVDIGEIRVIAELVAQCVGPQLSEALDADEPPLRRVAHVGPRVDPSRPSEPAVAPCGGARVQPCPRCQHLFTQTGYAEHRDACKAAYVWCPPCGHVHVDDSVGHRAHCTLECGTCGQAVPIGPFKRHSDICRAKITCDAEKLKHSPPSGPGQKRFRPSAATTDDIPTFPDKRRRKSGDAALTA